jgi:DsbC/DsbD-like thiol-disulfide interchange protein
MIILRDKKLPFIVALLCALWSQHALAGASKWDETTGARLRVVTEDPQPGAETLRGVLQIDLEPGWKTYWREPGASGIPPSVEAVSGATEAAVHFPVPHWVDQSYGSWAGYTEPVSLPITFTLEDGATSVAVNVFLGICHDVCVPVTGQFEVPLEHSSGSMLQSIQVDAAFANLPGGNTQALSVSKPRWTEDGLLEIRVAHDGGPDDTQLFVSGGEKHGFKKPVAAAEDQSGTVFRVEPLFDPAEAGSFELIVAVRNGNDSAEITAGIVAP